MKKIVFFLFLMIFSTVLFADSLKQIVFFGDSLSDDGNLYKLFHLVPQSPPYYDGRFSNGPTWAELVGQAYIQKYSSEYDIYAVGGATTLLHNPINDKFIAPVILQEEINAYLRHSIKEDKNQTLYAIWIGANDYLFDETLNTNKLTSQVVDKIIDEIKILIEKGGKHFLIMNLPDLSKTPFAQSSGQATRLSALSIMHNDKLTQAMATLSHDYPEIKITYFDVYTLFLDFLNNPAKYNQLYNVNITDTTTACWMGAVLLNQKNPENEKMHYVDTLLSSPALATAYGVGQAYEKGATPCSNPDEHIFWDQMHPTRVIHSILAQIVFEAVDATMQLNNEDHHLN